MVMTTRFMGGILNSWEPEAELSFGSGSTQKAVPLSSVLAAGLEAWTVPRSSLMMAVWQTRGSVPGG